MADQIIKILNDLSSRMEVAVDWTAENIVPYLQDLGTRIATYVFWSKIIGICILVVLSIIAAIVCIVVLKKINFNVEYYETKESVAVICLIISGIMIVGSLIAIPMMAVDAVEAKYLPEKAIYSYVESTTRQARNLSNNN